MPSALKPQIFEQTHGVSKRNREGGEQNLLLQCVCSFRLCSPFDGIGEIHLGKYVEAADTVRWLFRKEWAGPLRFVLDRYSNLLEWHNPNLRESRFQVNIVSFFLKICPLRGIITQQLSSFSPLSGKIRDKKDSGLI